MLKRTLQPYILRDATWYPVVSITGPRQSGKTTLAKACFPDYEYISLEEPELRGLAKSDPQGFLTRYSGNVIFDEIQRAPDILSYIQSRVDKDDSPGKYVLTGSQNFLLMEQISQTLAGRCGILHLLPFSRSELESQDSADPNDFKDLFSNTKTGLACWDAVYTGFYPRIHDRGIPPDIWLSDYIQSYIERDVRRLVNVGDVETFERFLRLCAGRTGQLLNYSSLAMDCGISVDTARRWISILKTSFIVFLLRPHHRNFNKRLIKSPKLFFYDTGLASNLLGIRNKNQLCDHPLRGALFENYAIAEVYKSYTHHRREPPVYFWRDQSGHEIDLLIDESGQLHPVEIKSGATFNASMLNSLIWWNQLAGYADISGTLVYGGNNIFNQRGIDVRPWFST